QVVVVGVAVVALAGRAVVAVALGPGALEVVQARAQRRAPARPYGRREFVGQRGLAGRRPTVDADADRVGPLHLEDAVDQPPDHLLTCPAHGPGRIQTTSA